MESDYSAAFRNMADAAAKAAQGMRQFSETVGKVKFTRTIKLHPSFNAIEVPIWAPIFRKAVK